MLATTSPAKHGSPCFDPDIEALEETRINCNLEHL